MKQFTEIGSKKDLSEYISKSPFWFVTIDFILLNISFFICNYLKRGSFNLLPEYGKLLLLFYFCWFFASHIGGKFKVSSYSSLINSFITIARSSFYITYSIGFLVVVLGLEDYSRQQVFSTCIGIYVLEMIALFFYFSIIKNHQIKEGLEVETIKYKRKEYGSYFLIGVDIFLVIITFFIVNYIKRGNFILLPQYDKLLLLIYGVWFLCSMVTKKFYVKGYKNFSFYFWQWLKASIMMIAILSIVVFGFRLFYFPRFQVFGSIILLITLEIIVLLLYRWSQDDDVKRSDIDSVETVKTILKQEKLSINLDIETIRQKLLEPARIKLKSKLSNHYPELFEFIDTTIDLNEFISVEAAIGYCNNGFELNSDDTLVSLFLNLKKINDNRTLNQYFLNVHQILRPGGYFIAWAHTIKTHKEFIYSKYPLQIANGVYLMDFCINRVMPKIPILKKIYFALTKGKSRIISRAEVLGRLCFCGFDIIAEKEIRKRLCFIVRKVKTPSLDLNPSYGPIVALKRIGYKKKIINIYKLRTMHPYSEYLQEYTYENCGGLIDGDGFRGDFRITAWGKIFRKLWIDELPMLINWFRGDVKIVGVRPLSEHKFSLYTKKMQKLRVSVKPGLVPPFYADLPQNLEELQNSEMKYTKCYLKKPFVADFKYFFLAAVNIIFKKARSK